MDLKSGPIGVFDSGYGGLTVFASIVNAMPQYEYIYLGDNARAPYGPLDQPTIYDYTLDAVSWLFNQGCNMVILACNTASASALRTIQQKYLQGAEKRRVLGVIRPTAEVIEQFSGNNHIGIFGTKGTVDSNSYPIEIHKLNPDIKVSQVACPGWVSLIEKGDLESQELESSIKTNVQELMDKDPLIDTILLACTHYPIIQDKIEQFVPSEIKVIPQGEIVAISLGNYLERHQDLENHISRHHNITFFTTGNTDNFDEHGSLFFGRKIKSIKVNLDEKKLWI